MRKKEYAKEEIAIPQKLYPCLLAHNKTQSVPAITQAGEKKKQ
jgi:hypothetical protein